jgi:hypothetical protein
MGGLPHLAWGGECVVQPMLRAGPASYRQGMELTLPVLAGMVSTAVFAGSVLPMLHKALRTRELSSYSLSNITLANVGNVVHSVYVFDLPPGPIWFLHTFYLVSSALMLYWYLRTNTVRRGRPLASSGAGSMTAMTAKSSPVTSGSAVTLTR